MSDWQDTSHLAIHYGKEHLLEEKSEYWRESLNFRHMVGKYGGYLYALFEVSDDTVVLRGENSLRVDRNDHLQIALIDPEENFKRYIVASQSSGWVNVYLMDQNPESKRPVGSENRIQGYWRITTKGYNLELRIPLTMLSSNIAFAIVDVDDHQSRAIKYRIGTANTSQPSSLGTVLVPSPEIENIIKALKYSQSRVWVVDKHRRVLARSGSIQQAPGLGSQATQEGQRASGWWQTVEQDWLLPLYYRVLTRPPADFIDDLKNAYALKGKELASALGGKASTLWRLSSDAKAVILSAAHPIWLDEKVMGAVVVEQTTHSIRSLRNKALEKLFHLILSVMGLGTLALFLFASRMSFQMLDKIIANAVEFSEDNNQIVVRLSQRQTTLSLSIENKGACLPENMQRELLDSMVSVRPQHNPRQAHSQPPHLGLGLYIAKIIADYHRAKISIANLTNNDGVVVTVSFNLP
ncbi:MAG: ATP-binding protein [Pseudomonadales bacterium]